MAGTVAETVVARAMATAEKVACGAVEMEEVAEAEEICQRNKYVKILVVIHM